MFWSKNYYYKNYKDLKSFLGLCLRDKKVYEFTIYKKVPDSNNIKYKFKFTYYKKLEKYCLHLEFYVYSHFHSEKKNYELKKLKYSNLFEYTKEEIKKIIENKDIIIPSDVLSEYSDLDSDTIYKIFYNEW